jgi:AcrR family transcriptional regulator
VPKDAYHHGNLANALLDAALAVVETQGAEALYRHFEDRDALLMAVAARGLEALASVYDCAGAGPGDGPARLRQAMRDYMAFAWAHPGLHRLMFESDLLKREPLPASLKEPYQAIYEALWRVLTGAYPSADEAWLKRRRVTMLSTVVGFLVLDEAGRFTPAWAAPLSREDMIETVIETAVGAPPP